MNQTRLIVILSAILLAVIVGSGILIFLLPSSSPTPTITPTTDETATTATTAPTGQGNFNTGVFQRSDYVVLDRQMIQDGRLPVQPPANAGKANPFL